jgi:hypothetical protein
MLVGRVSNYFRTKYGTWQPLCSDLRCWPLQVMATLLTEMLAAYFLCIRAPVDQALLLNPNVTWLGNGTFVQTYYDRSVCPAYLIPFKQCVLLLVVNNSLSWAHEIASRLAASDAESNKSIELSWPGYPSH